MRFEIRRGGAAVAAFAVRYGGVVRGYVNRCAHVGVELDWMPGRFFDTDGRTLVCATHGATYDAASGRCNGGPCKGGALEAVALVERDGGVFLVPPDESQPL